MSNLNLNPNLTTQSRLAILDAFVYHFYNDGADYDSIELVQVSPGELVVEWRDALSVKHIYKVLVNQDDGKSINVYSFEEI